MSTKTTIFKRETWLQLGKGAVLALVTVGGAAGVASHTAASGSADSDSRLTAVETEQRNIKEQLTGMREDVRDIRRFLMGERQR